MTARRVQAARVSAEAGLDESRLAWVDDRALADAVAGGDHAAFAEIFERYSGRALALARHAMGDASRAEEVVQEVFVRLWSQPQRFDPGRGSMRNFLLADVHGRAIDALRKDGRRVDRERRDHDRPTVPARGAESTAVERAVAGDVRAALAGLAEDEREAISLAYLGGHTYREVAAILGLPEGTIKSRIRSGLVRLRPKLDGLQSLDDH